MIIMVDKACHMLGAHRSGCALLTTVFMNSRYCYSNNVIHNYMYVNNSC